MGARLLVQPDDRSMTVSQVFFDFINSDEMKIWLQ